MLYNTCHTQLYNVTIYICTVPIQLFEIITSPHNSGTQMSIICANFGENYTFCINQINTSLTVLCHFTKFRFVMQDDLCEKQNVTASMLSNE